MELSACVGLLAVNQVMELLYRGCRLGRHDRYSREIRHRAWDIKTRSW